MVRGRGGREAARLLTREEALVDGIERARLLQFAEIEEARSHDDMASLGDDRILDLILALRVSLVGETETAKRVMLRMALLGMLRHFMAGKEAQHG
jgi:hypothetical protein